MGKPKDIEEALPRNDIKTETKIFLFFTYLCDTYLSLKTNPYRAPKRPFCLILAMSGQEIVHPGTNPSHEVIKNCLQLYTGILIPPHALF